MSQNDFNIANQGFPQFRADLNSALQALASTSSGATAPGTTYAYQLWYDTSTNLLKMRNADNDAWITLALFDQTADEWELRTAVVQAVDSAGVVIKTDDGTTRLTVADNGDVTLANDLSVAGTVQAANISATGALSNRNKIINGAMTIDQRNAGAAVTYGSQPYITDRFSVEKANLATLVATAQQVSDAPDGFRQSLKTTVTTAEASGASSFFVAADYRVEGYDFADFSFGTAGAKTFTLSFWVKASVTGTYCVSFFNSDVSRAYLATYAVSSASTWEYKTITVAGDTSGTWNITNGIGLGAQFSVGGGSNQEGTPGAWSGTYKRTVSGAVDLNATLNATWQITGVQLEAGDTATPFEHRSYGQELALCQRYFERIEIGNGGVAATGQCVSSTDAVVPILFSTRKRAAPTFSATASWIVLTNAGGLAGGTLASTVSSASGARINASSASGLVAGNATLLFANGSGQYLDFSAEL